MRSMSREYAALRTRAHDAERARDRAEADSSRREDELSRLTAQRDDLLLGATRAGHASSPSEALVQLLAAAALGARAGGAEAAETEGRAELEGREELVSALEQARAEAKVARVAAQQERLRREEATRDKEEALRQLHRLVGAARRAVGRRDSRLRSSRMETEIVWNALARAVR